jgi:hypothetical protein
MAAIYELLKRKNRFPVSSVMVMLLPLTSKFRQPRWSFAATVSVMFLGIPPLPRQNSPPEFPNVSLIPYVLAL